MDIQLNQEEYVARIKHMTIVGLIFIMKDASKAISDTSSMPDGSKVGSYLDEINYCSAELSTRIKKAVYDSETFLPSDNVVMFNSALTKTRVYLERGDGLDSAISKAKKSVDGKAPWDLIKDFYRK